MNISRLTIPSAWSRIRHTLRLLGQGWFPSRGVSVRNNLVFRLGVSLVIAYAGYSCAQDPKTTTQKREPTKPGASVCNPSAEPGFLKSWRGQAGIPDHIDRRSLNKGAWILCLASSSDGVGASCHISYEHGNGYSLPNHGAVKAPSAGIIALECKGEAPACCKVQTAGALRLLREKTDPQLRAVSATDAEDKILNR